MTKQLHQRMYFSPFLKKLKCWNMKFAWVYLITYTLHPSHSIDHHASSSGFSISSELSLKGFAKLINNCFVQLRVHTTTKHIKQKMMKMKFVLLNASSLLLKEDWITHTSFIKSIFTTNYYFSYHGVMQQSSQQLSCT